MPFGQIDAVCSQVSLTSREICISYPVGQQMCVSLPQIAIPDPSEQMQAFFAQINSALTPLTPVFNIIDAVLAVFECIQALPKVITELDPTELINCIPGLAEAVQRLLKMIPQLSIPIMIVETIDAILIYLQGQIDILNAFAARQQAIIEANTRAALPGNFQLGLIMDCVNANFDVDLANLNEQAGPLNRMIGIINALVELIGLDPLPTLGDIANITDGLDQMQQFLDTLKSLRSTIPVPLDP